MRNITRRSESTSTYADNGGRQESNTLREKDTSVILPCFSGSMKWLKKDTRFGEEYEEGNKLMKVSNKMQKIVLWESETSTRKAIS